MEALSAVRSHQKGDEVKIELEHLPNEE